MVSVVPVPVDKIHTLFSSHPKLFFQTNGKHLPALKDLSCDETPTGVQRSNLQTRAPRMLGFVFKITNKLERTSSSIAEYLLLNSPLGNMSCWYHSYLALRLGGIKQNQIYYIFIAKPQDDFFCFIPWALVPSRKFNLSELVYWLNFFYPLEDWKQYSC